MKRRYFHVSAVPNAVRKLCPDWKGMRSVGRVVTITERAGETVSDARHYISSLRPAVKRFAAAVRGH